VNYVSLQTVTDALYSTKEEQQMEEMTQCFTRHAQTCPDAVRFYCAMKCRVSLIYLYSY